MSANLDFAEQVHVVPGFLPVALSTGANNGDWISMKGYGKCTVIFFKNVGKAGEDPTVVFEQATSIGGSGKDLDVIDKVWVKQNTTLLAEGTFTIATQSAATSYTEATSGEDSCIWMMDFYGDEMDVANGYDCFRATVADIGTATPNAGYGALLYLLWPARYGEQALLSAIVD